MEVGGGEDLKAGEGPCESRVCDGMMHVLARSDMSPWKQSGDGEDALSIKSEALSSSGGGTRRRHFCFAGSRGRQSLSA